MNFTPGSKKLVVLLGMHRSGTSAITRGLQVLGVELGTNLMPANPQFNAKGFWEDIDFNALNMEMLNAIGIDWHFLAPVQQKDIDKLRLKGYHKRAIELLHAKLVDRPVFGVKDPRIAKLMPFWKEVFEQSGVEVNYVLALRNPISVAKSLERRDGFELGKSYFLWLDHMLRGLAESQGAKRVMVDYDCLMAAPDKELKKIARALCLSLDATELERYTSEFLDETLNHWNYQVEDLQQSAEMPRLVREVFEVLYDVAREKTDIDNPMLLKQLEGWLQRLEDMRTAMKLADRYWMKSADLSRTVLEHKERIVDLGNFLAERDKQAAELNEEVIRHSHLVMERDNQLKELRQNLKELRQNYDGIVKSNSWKVTRPFREVRRWLTNPNDRAQLYLGLLSRLLKQFYSTLPFDHQTRMRHRRLIEKYLPGFLHSANLTAFASSSWSRPACRPEYDPDTYQGGIYLATSLEPVVSVIIPVYGKCGCTLRCLASIADNTPLTSFEVIVIDDYSPDKSVEVLQGVSGIRLISNPRNMGFIRSCNIGAQAAKGQYVYFLNNDTEVTPGWLDELLRTFHIFPNTGLAGSKLIYPDGSLQEAGGIIWQDGSAWNFGRHQDPMLPVFNYAREVDYCSGASIMILKSLFDELNGFDEYYLPAYCEDSDIAIKIRDKGYSVIYQPLSTIIHYEGLTSGTDTSHGTKAYQVENSKKLFVRWQKRFQNHQPHGVNIDKAKDRYVKQRVLVIDHCTPTPDQDAGSLTVFNLMLLLREMGFQVTFIPDSNFLYLPKYTTALQAAGIEMLYAPYVTAVEQHLKNNGYRYNLVFLFRPGVAEHHLDLIRALCPQAKILYHTVDLHFLRMQREADLQNDTVKKKASDQMRQCEYAIIRSVDASIVHSTSELELLRSDLPGQKISVFPLIMDVCGTHKGFKERLDIMFLGGYQHQPNIDAVMYFVSKIMPILRQRLPGVRFFAVGSKPTTEMMALACEDIVITGFIDDLSSFSDKIRVAVAPLRYGAGIKGKIGTTMSFGLPSVATSLAVEGMSLTDGENILVANNEESFAAAIARLYEDERLWHSMSEAGIEFANKSWGVDAAWKILSEILGGLDIETKRPDYPLKLYSQVKK